MPKGKRIKMRFPELPSLVRNRPLCFETDLAGIADYYGCNYAVPLCEYLDFTYDDADTGAISDRLHVRKPLPQVYSAYGVAFRKNSGSKRDCAVSVIKGQHVFPKITEDQGGVPWSVLMRCSFDAR